MGLANAERVLAIVSAALQAPENLVAMEAAFAIVSITVSILGIQFVTPPFGVDGPFPPTSCGYPQVQTVPSSQWDAPCPVVTPSPDGAWLGVFCQNYFITFRENRCVQSMNKKDSA